MAKKKKSANIFGAINSAVNSVVGTQAHSFLRPQESPQKLDYSNVGDSARLRSPGDASTGYISSAFGLNADGSPALASLFNPASASKLRVQFDRVYNYFLIQCQSPSQVQGGLLVTWQAFLNSSPVMDPLPVGQAAGFNQLSRNAKSLDRLAIVQSYAFVPRVQFDEIRMVLTQPILLSPYIFTAWCIKEPFFPLIMPVGSP